MMKKPLSQPDKSYRFLLDHTILQTYDKPLAEQIAFVDGTGFDEAIKERVRERLREIDRNNRAVKAIEDREGMLPRRD